ncbi:VOC family protein [Luteibacter yeojuensis]|uniref:Glyoxalase/bleomycin resistance protein/dioxygenase n=1 Tax=Luteibacter yeojuensis TaxID=345309 RepID=A0A0F3KWX0_9GAMM|nr:VOC family protein [Luteibacter yeojuensis]KJV35713.1 glyoxalase/bleomycin resistance protein/dioxygenase [Luteibacter yeojuensis]
MSVRTVTHLNFRGQARDALHFYRQALAGQLTLVSYGDAGQPGLAADPSHVIWGQVATDAGFHVMAYDVQADLPWNPGENAFFISLRCDSEDEARTLWNALGEGGTVREPMGPSPWSPLYGKLEDRFGVIWLIDVAVAYR